MAALHAARLAAAGAAGAAAGHLLARSEARPAAPAGAVPQAAAGLSREERMRIPAWAGAGAPGGPTGEGSAWEELDLHSRYGESLSGNAVHDTLLGEGMLETVRLLKGGEAGRVRGEFRIGSNLCGHPGKVHGGVTATAFDTTFGWSCYLTGQETLGEAGGPGGGFPIQFFTAQLEVNYRTPVPCGETVVFHTRQVKREGRKLWLEGVATDRAGQVKYADANALFIEVAKESDSD